MIRKAIGIYWRTQTPTVDNWHTTGYRTIASLGKVIEGDNLGHYSCREINIGPLMISISYNPVYYTGGY